MKIAVIAGEKSGDNYGALLIDAIRKIEKDVFVIGTGGEGIREKADLFIKSPYGRMGFSGVISHLPLFYHAFKKVKEILKKECPSFIVFIDNPGFNLKLAQVLGEKFPCFYYIPPKVWAHNYGRIRIMKKYIKAVITIFPFEEGIYKKEGIPAFWFGHPVTDLIKTEQNLKERYNIPVIGLLPGSREKEVRYLLPVFIHTVKIISKRRRVKTLLSASDMPIKRIEEEILKKYHTEMEIIEGSPHIVIRYASVVLAASGTVNLEVALLQKPLLVFYKTKYLDYLIARSMVKLKIISPVNLLAGEKVIPEYIQYFPYRKITGDIEDILNKGALYRQEQELFSRIAEIAGRGNVSEAVAEFLIKNYAKRDIEDKKLC
ncbi:MAG: lipid-A-disaccharide synthase [Candidatus Omnitrophica bacterium]|nr:lipid-A-disaccharide synthase [Candidatus Omnitrophota bacterium]